jgi:hypothetical protein
MNRRFFVGVGFFAFGAMALRSFYSFGSEKRRLFICVSGIRKSDAIRLGWFIPDEASEKNNTAPFDLVSEKIRPLRKSEAIIFSKKNSHLEKLQGLLGFLGFADNGIISKKLREDCKDRPLTMDFGKSSLFYFDGLEAGHKGVTEYFEILEKTEKWVRETLIVHFDRYGKNATYVICSEIGRDEIPGQDIPGFHHNSEDAAYGFVSSSES